MEEGKYETRQSPQSVRRGREVSSLLNFAGNHSAVLRDHAWLSYILSLCLIWLECVKLGNH